MLWEAWQPLTVSLLVKSMINLLDYRLILASCCGGGVGGMGVGKEKKSQLSLL